MMTEPRMTETATKETSGGICLVEDDAIMGEALSRFFELERLPCDWFRTLEGARAALRGRHYCALVSDLRLPDGDGGELYRELAQEPAHLPPTLFITAYGSVAQAVDLLKLGARDYITKPFEPDELMVKLRRACPALFERGAVPGRSFLGVSAAMRRVEQVLERVARHRVPVLITGESGVGKEHAARYLHLCRFGEGGPPFIGVNCAAVPPDLIEAELFGAERGAYTGSVGTRKGLFEQAGAGTLFLDEVGDMPLPMQAKLLRVVQERTLRRVGGTQDLPYQAQLVWATNCDLQRLVAEGRFREDLLFRISTVHVELPPLRERPEDALWFAHKFVESFARENGRHCCLTPKAERYLAGRPWSGNVRALKQAVERAAIFSESGVLEPESFRSAGALDPLPEYEDQVEGLRDYLAECERWYINRALERCGGRIGESADLLGISRKSLWERMNRLGIGRGAAERSGT
jgi:DNA-binding NtrC family response regulator